MLRALVLGVLSSASLAQAATSGAITARLTLFSRCEIGSVGVAGDIPAIQCGAHSSAQPRVTQRVLTDAVRHQSATRLITMEW
ncbi:hypothetical protein [[Erwinia] mediterraneensis]|uniref:hypothetical protein n=1 Tax=[Erwinia] mediterraneensis TaxID=2161819 RepID=UPI00103156DA|nr:hypothetical protein [[Erwinia] mediterraneensis]